MLGAGTRGAICEIHLKAAVAEVQPAPLPTVKGRRWGSEILELRGFPCPHCSQTGICSVLGWSSRCLVAANDSSRLLTDATYLATAFV